ncbi:hypothetical protein [Pedobacter antarcticus]|nr:hypothetical protein [Pedobacter antarcticus]
MNPTKRTYDIFFAQFANQMLAAKAMYHRFLSQQYKLGDSFLKSSKDFIS